MKKIKQIIKYCFIFIAAIFGCVAFSGVNTLETVQEASKAATPVTLYANLRERSNGVTVTNPEVKITDWVVSSNKKEIVFNLTHDKFNYYSNETVFASDPLDSPSNGTTLIHQSGLISNVTSSDTANVTKNGQFVTTIALPGSMQNAMLNGAVSIDSTAKLITKWLGNVLWWTDSPEKITMEMSAYNDALSVGTDIQKYEFASTLKGSGFKNKTVSADGALSLSKDKLTGHENLDFLSLSFKSEINGDCYNYMQIENPVVKFTTDDVAKPTISYNTEELNTGWVNTSKILKIAATDAYSGISAVYINGTEVEVTFSNNTKDATYEYKINENGTYVVEVVDNVGNTETITYTESNIDKVKPNATIEIGETFTNKTVPFSATIVPSSLSVDTFTASYVATDLYGQAVRDISSSFTFVNGENTIVFPENGSYTITFTGVDEATNEMSEIIVCITVDDRTNVVLDIADTYTYTTSAFTPSFIKSVDGDYEIVFTYRTEAGAIISSINNIGNYVVEYLIDAYLFKGAGTQAVVVSPRQVELSNVQTTYSYTGRVLEVIFDKSIDIETNVTYYKNSETVELKNAGEYNCIIVPKSSNYVITNGTYDLTVNKQVLAFDYINADFVYSNETKALTFSLTNQAKNTEIEIDYYNSNKDLISASEVVDANTYYAVFSYVGETENYEFNAYAEIGAAYEFEIEKREISVNVVSQNLVYGDARDELSYTLSNALDSESLTFTLSTNYEIYAGTYDILVDQKYSLTDEEAEVLKNYDVTYNEGTIVVSAKVITIVPTQKQSKIYGDEDKTLTFSVDGLVYGDTLSGELSREEGEGVGYYNITIGTITDSNYAISLASERFEIVKRMAFIFIHNATKVYGETDPEFSFNTGSSNFIVADLETIETLNMFVRESGEDVGKYNISLNSDLLESHEMFNNYNVLHLDATFVVTKAVVYAAAENKQVNYGDTAPLTYIFTNKPIADDITLELSREEGVNVGEYEIVCNNTRFTNFDVVFTPATYTIVPREITISALDSTKVYGEEDNIACEVINAVEDLEITMLRNAGENVGKYMINSFVFENSNYKVVEFKTAWLEITKANISVTLNNATKTYGSADPIFGYEVVGLAFGDEIELNTFRAEGENAGEYEISCEVVAFENYAIENVTNGVLVVTKADLTYTLPNFNLVYSGSAVNLEVDDFEFELEFSFLNTMDEPIDAPTSAGEYIVSAYFAGNENYNPFSTNSSKLVIEKKVVPITLKKQTFLYNGRAQSPEYDINLDTPVSVIIEFENNAEPIEVGEYNFTIISNDANYICSFSSTLKIVDEFYDEDESGASITTSNVNFSSSGIQIQLNLNSKYMSMFNPIFDGKKCLAVYEFIGSANSKTSGEVFTVKLKATDGAENVNIYTLDGNGNLTEVSYVLIDEYYVLSVNSLTADILITESNTMLKYIKMVAVVTVLTLSVFITKIINRRRRNSFFAKNTSVRLLDRELVKKNINIVYSRVNYDNKIPVKNIIKKWG